MSDIVIVNPRFEISFWGIGKCMKMLQTRQPAGCLPALVGRIVPKHHNVTLIDENVEEIDFDRLGRADMVCVTGMSIQGRRLPKFFAKFAIAAFSEVAGGAMATVEPEELEASLMSICRRGRYQLLPNSSGNGRTDVMARVTSKPTRLI